MNQRPRTTVNSEVAHASMLAHRRALTKLGVPTIPDRVHELLLLGVEQLPPELEAEADQAIATARDLLRARQLEDVRESRTGKLSRFDLKAKGKKHWAGPPREED